MTTFVCTACGQQSGKWLGQCPGCGGWNSFAEEVRTRAKSAARRTGSTPPIPVAEAAAASTERIRTGMEGVDRVLGGGLVPGSLVLLSGEPGIGKSTLLLQVAAALATAAAPALYVSAEESAEQVALRARRLDLAKRELLLLPETSCDAVLATLESLRPSVVVVDSVQTLTVEEVDGVAGSVSQVRQVAARFQQLAKTRGVPVILVGHVTKEGMIAGPKLLEHLVDVVLSLEGEPGHDLRALRASKNRFGAVAELALFAMTDAGLEGVRNASAWLLQDRRPGAPRARSWPPPWRAARRSWSMSRPWSPPRPWALHGGWPRGSTHPVSPSSSPSSSATPGSTSPLPTSTSTWPAAWPCASPPSTWPSPSPSCRAPPTERSRETWWSSARSVSWARCARSAAPPSGCAKPRRSASAGWRYPPATLPTPPSTCRPCRSPASRICASCWSSLRSFQLSAEALAQIPVPVAHDDLAVVTTKDENAHLPPGAQPRIFGPGLPKPAGGAG